MRIVVDAMGSDARPVPDVAGAVAAVREHGVNVILVGNESKINAELAKHDAQGLVQVAHADQEITMSDKPSVVGKGKPDSSMHVGLNLVKTGEADAFVTAGNTGAAYAVAMLHTLGRIQGVKRPALSIIFPFNERKIVFLDVGANADAKPEWLVQFAIMGEIYADNVLGIKNPRVGLLSNGEEEGKGSQLVREADIQMRQVKLQRYIGNVEPTDITHNNVDVVISDGFTGNIMIKSFEASTRYLAQVIRDELKANVFTSIGGLISKPALQRARHKLNSATVGGGPLLGVNGVVIIGHGSSDTLAIKNAIFQAQAAVEGRTIQTIQAGISHLTVKDKER